MQALSFATPKQTSGMCAANDSACIWRAWSRYSWSTGAKTPTPTTAAVSTCASSHRRSELGDVAAKQARAPSPGVVAERTAEHPKVAVAEQHESHQLDRRHCRLADGADRRPRRQLDRIPVDAGRDRGKGDRPAVERRRKL